MLPPHAMGLNLHALSSQTREGVVGKRKRSKCRVGAKGLSKRSAPPPVASLASRWSRTMAAPPAEPNYYLDLADIALGRKPGPAADREEENS